MTTDLALAIAPSFPELARIEEACRLLAAARSIDEVKAIRDMAEAARIYARQAQLGLEAQNHAAEIKLRAERRAGELLRDMPKRNGARPFGADLHDVSPPPTLGEIGISHAQSHRWQAIASLPLPTFEDHIADAQDRGQELTSAGALRLAAGQQRAARASVSVPAVLPSARPSRVLLLIGDVRAGLVTLAAQSVQTVPTSVPYWGLRSYGTEPQVWGGEPGHAHDWSAVRPWAWCPGGGNYTNSTISQSGQRRRELVQYKQPDSGTCACGAWLGELGTEPTPELYVEHIVEVFRHLRRVLRKDGTVWLNIGQSMAGSGKGPTGWNGASDQELRQGFTGEGKKYAAGAAGGVIGAPELGVLSRKSVSGHRSGAGPVGGYKAKDIVPIPWLVAMALQVDGWYWRSTIAWCKKAPMPESVDDRPTSAWEPILLLSKSNRYFYDKEAVMESTADSNTHSRGNGVNPKSRLNGYAPGQETANMPRLHRAMHTKQNESWSAATNEVLPTRNMRNVWLLGPEPFPGAHFAVFPTEVPRRCILAGSRPGDLILDPFSGAGTTSMVAARLGRDSVGIDLKREYVDMARDRIQADGGFTVDVELQEIQS